MIIDAFANLPNPDVITQEIVDDRESALEQVSETRVKLKEYRDQL